MHENCCKMLLNALSCAGHVLRKFDLPYLVHHLAFKGGYLDFSHLNELKNIYVTEIYIRKQYKSSKIKNKEITEKNFFDGGSLIKGYEAS